MIETISGNKVSFSHNFTPEKRMPSLNIESESGGKLPAIDPPTSIQWATEIEKVTILFLKKIGLIIAKSQGWVPPVNGSFVKYISPLEIFFPNL